MPTTRASSSLTLRQFLAFSQVAELKSFSEAGKVLHVSQPALTRTIHQIEESLGVRLFDRDTRNLQLTAMGNQLLPIVRRVLGEFETACCEMTQFVEGLHGTLHVAALPCVAAMVLPPLIADFCTTHPKVDFKITESLSRNVAAAVLDGQCDFGVAVRVDNNDRIDYKHLIDDAIFMVCRDDDPLACRKEVPWSAFKNRRFISMGSNCNVRAITEQTFSELGLNIKPSFECQNLLTTRNLIAAGLGISAVSALMLPQFATGNIVARQLIRPTRSRSVGIMTRLGHAVSPVAQEFLAALTMSALDVRQEVISLAPAS